MISLTLYLVSEWPLWVSVPSAEILAASSGQIPRKQECLWVWGHTEAGIPQPHILSCFQREEVALILVNSGSPCLPGCSCPVRCPAVITSGDFWLQKCPCSLWTFFLNECKEESKSHIWPPQNSNKPPKTVLTFWCDDRSRGQKGRRRERSEDATRLALRTEEGATSQTMQVASRSL